LSSSVVLWCCPHEDQPALPSGPLLHAIDAKVPLMNPDPVSDAPLDKADARKRGMANRTAQIDKDGLSRRILDRFLAHESYRRASNVLFYVGVRDEVRTAEALAAAIEDDHRVLVPYCVDGRLELFQLEDLGELRRGAFGILEPLVELRGVNGRSVAMEEVDVALVPGVAFDLRGARVGHGYGYYDKLLHQARSDATLVGVAFECQVFPAIAHDPHDVFMDYLITERTVHDFPGRRLRSPSD